MAGKGPPPKDPTQRRNHHEPQRGEWVDLEPLAEPVLPELPPASEEGWPAATVLAWAAWRSDPVTARYSEADVAYALDTIRLHAAMTPTSASEVRLRMDSLGLTPKGKRDLRWRIVVPDDDAQREPPAPVASASERRARLSVVGE